MTRFFVASVASKVVNTQQSYILCTGLVLAYLKMDEGIFNELLA